MARLAPISKAEAQGIPPFNPFKLYANTTPLEETDARRCPARGRRANIVELLGGILPNEDGQELSRRRSLTSSPEPRRGR